MPECYKSGFWPLQSGPIRLLRSKSAIKLSVTWTDSLRYSQTPPIRWLRWPGNTESLKSHLNTFILKFMFCIRETLVRATLPNFHLPAAVEVLTLGQYTRVPKCVRERLVPPEPISLEEKRITLLKINQVSISIAKSLKAYWSFDDIIQVIEHRLVSSDLPLKMRNLRIENGFVTFIVNNEFEATLTLTGDSQSVPWRLLKLNILVKDKETGEGKPLVHALQVEKS